VWPSGSGSMPRLYPPATLDWIRVHAFAAPRQRVQEVDAELGKAFGRPGPLGSADEAGAADWGGSHAEAFEQ
jgi:hypothetical protein